MPYIAEIDGKEHRIEIEKNENNFYSIIIGDKKYKFDAVHSEHSLYSLILNGKSYEIDLDGKDGVCSILIKGEHYVVNVINEKKKGLRTKSREHTIEGKQFIITEMPGKVVKILVQKGNEVKLNQGLVVIEAMKMENELKSPKNGKVIEINIKEGETVEGGTALMLIE